MHTVEELSDGHVLMPDYCMIQLHKPPEQTEGGIYYSDKWAPEQTYGLVKNMGEFKHDPGFEVHDWVLFSRWAGREFETSDGETMVLVRNKDVIAVIEADDGDKDQT